MNDEGRDESDRENEDSDGVEADSKEALRELPSLSSLSFNLEFSSSCRWSLPSPMYSYKERVHKKVNR